MGKNKIITKQTRVSINRILFGMIFILLAIVILLNHGFISKFIFYILAYLLGSLYFVLPLLMIVHGLKLIFNLNFKVNIFVKMGLLILFLGIDIGISHNSSLTLNNFFISYNNVFSQVQNGLFNIPSHQIVFAHLNGGFLSYFINGIFNSIFNDGGYIVSLILLGMSLLFFVIPLLIYIIHNISYRKKFVSVEHNVNIKEDRKNILENKNNNEKLDESKLEKFEQEMETFVPKNDNLSIEPEIKDENIMQKNDVTYSVNTKKIEEVKHDSSINDQKINELNDIIETRKVIPEELMPNINTPKQTYVNETVPSMSIKEETKQEEKSHNIFSTNKIEENTISNTQVDDSLYILPPLNLLKDRYNAVDAQKQIEVSMYRLQKINDCFKDFDIGATAISYTIGPSVTRYNIKLNPNVKTSALNALENDLAVRLDGNRTVRIETIVEGLDTCGIEVGNTICETVSFKDCMRAIADNTKDHLLFPLGKDISGKVVSCKLNEMPHLLIAGTTGSGKSVFIHNIITALIMRNKPSELKLMLIDPKRVEFLRYQNLPHLLCPILTDTAKGALALKRLTEEMDRRYDLFAEKGYGACSYDEYMEVCIENNLPKIPYIVMICDEFADFLLDSDKEVSRYIQRLAQKARACGIFMIIATQRPSAKVITGEIKANIPSRIALSVSSSLESRIIVDEPGAENLMGKGDLLARIPSHHSLLRVQSPFIDSKEIYTICEYIKKYGKVNYDPNFEILEPKPVSSFDLNDELYPMGRDFHQDELFEKVKQYVIKTGKCSTNKLINAFGIGFSRADGLLEALENDGIIKKEGNRRVLSEEYQDNVEIEEE